MKEGDRFQGGDESWREHRWRVERLRRSASELGRRRIEGRLVRWARQDFCGRKRTVVRQVVVDELLGARSERAVCPREEEKELSKVDAAGWASREKRTASSRAEREGR
jgi:hypothetical protein